ncbi:hypothetical protein [Nesterenkonia sp. Act20]|uniref:hypothetical protein n=1 Tax=Nesterenkonia sp. Act20 TaxID=1483432 RepID=UPI001C464822|nr:hypothetical protein [Nesterenkonia sp. Act20]
MTDFPSSRRDRRTPPGRSLRTLGWVAFVVLGSAAAWFAWMGWDQEYWEDPETGTPQGPYRAWQVIGCGVTLVAIGVWTSRSRCWPAVLLLPPSFTLAWSITASEDDTGLWMVGAIMVLIGTSLGTAIVMGIVRTARSLAKPR